MEEDEGKEETEASSQGKAECKGDGEEDNEGKEGEEGAGKSDDKEEKKDKDTDMVKQNEVSLHFLLFCIFHFQVFDTLTKIFSPNTSASEYESWPFSAPTGWGNHVAAPRGSAVPYVWPLQVPRHQGEASGIF